MKRNVAKRVGAPTRRPAERYTATSYGRAVARAVERANRPLVEAGVELEFHVAHWHPHQLRHAHATTVRKLFGLEAAGAALGHDRLSATELYAQKNYELARRIAAEVG